ncbi:MAG: VPLPA-CTERM sorting domain-containing protein [Pseudomonadota bacterium]
MTKFLTTTALVVAALAAAPAVATTYSHTSKNNVGAPNKTKDIYDSTYIYEDTTERFSLSFDVDSSAGVDGFWFVVNDGPMPVGGVEGKYAIIYSDLDDIWAYQYNGSGNNNGSYKGDLLQKWEGAVSDSTSGGLTTYEMLIDATKLNAKSPQADWMGLMMGEKIGTWLHPTLNTFKDCDEAGEKPKEIGNDLNCFNSNNWIGWDEANVMTTVTEDDGVLPPVPLPAGLPLLLAGLGAFGLAKRYKKA